MSNTKSSIYKNIYESKFFLNVIKKSLFDIKIPRSSFDKIISLYGKEIILPLSFINFCNPVQNKETVINMSGSIDMRSTLQINKIMDSLNNLYIYPTSYEGLDEIEKMKRSPKLKSKYLKNISKKMDMDFTDMINYLSIQITTIETRESISTLKNLELYLMIFNNIHTMKVKFPDKEKFDIAYYSYKSILNKCGINIDKVFPFFDVNRINDMKREEILKNEKSILYDKVIARELKEGIDKKIRQDKIDIYKGTDQCPRMPRPKYDDFEFYREKQSNILVKLSNNQKEGIIEIKLDESNNEEENKNKEEKENNEKKDENNQTKDVNLNDDKKEENKETVIELEKEEDINIELNKEHHEENKISEIKDEKKEENKETAIEQEKGKEKEKEEDIINIELDNENNEDKNKSSEIKEEKKEDNKKNEDIIIQKDETKNKIEENKNVQPPNKEEEIIIIKEDENEKNINIIEQVKGDKKDIIKENKKEGNNLLNVAQRFSSLKKGKDQQNKNDEKGKLVDKMDFKANNLDLIKFMTKFNALRKKKFKIRRAVFVKVEKDE